MLRGTVVVAWLAGTAGLLPAQSRPWSIADRAIVGSFTRISSIAVAPDRVYVSSPTALLIWDPRLRRWDGPFTPPDSSTLDRVFTALVDPLNNSLWLARVDGWVHFDPYRLNWQTGPVPAVVQGIAFDFDAPGAGLFVRTEQGWGVVAPGKNQFSPSQPPKRPLQPPTVTEALAAVPALRAGVAPGGGGQGGRAASYSAAARAFGGHGWYLGTWGDGLFSLLEGAVTPERLRFGLPGERVSAVAVAAGGVWVATDWSVGPGQTLSFVASDLSEFRWTAPGVKTERSFGAVRALAAQGPVLWGATDQGLARWNTEPAEFELIGGSRGLPDSRVLSVAAGEGGLAVGTAAGVARVRGGSIEPLTPGSRDSALAVAVSGDTIWVGTSHGLYVALPIEPEFRSPAGLEGSPAFRSRIRGLESADGIVVAMTEDRLFWRQRTGTWVLGPPLTQALGGLRAFTAYRGGFIVAGERGFGFSPPDSVPRRIFRIPDDVPGEVRQLVLSEDYLWMATSRGLVRWRLDVIRP